MSEMGFGHEDVARGVVSNDSIKQEPWLSRWWPLLVMGYGFLLSMFLLLIANETWGR